MKFISPIQHKPAEALPSIKAAPSPQKSFSSIFASELRSLSSVPCTSSAVVSSTNNTIAQPSQNTAAVAKTSFSQLFPNLAVPPVERASDQNKHDPSAAAANKMVPGIVNLPISNTSAVVTLDKGPANKKTGSIDIASIVNFHNPGTKSASPASQSGTIASIGDNQSVVISSRSQAPSNELGRYRMASSSQGQKGGVLAGGVMAAFKIEIG